MTTKFSQGARTQSLPPVCHAAVVMPVHWLPPPFPPMHGFVDFNVYLFNGQVKNYKATITLPWNNVLQQWNHQKLHSGYNLIHVIDPWYAGNLVRISVLVRPTLGYLNEWTWLRKPYTPHAAWESGGHYMSNPYMPVSFWGNYSTWVP